MKINLEFAELQTPLFLAGTNHGTKLSVDKRPVVLIYDREEKELLVYFNKKLAIIPASNIASMTPVEVAAIEAKPEVKAEAPKGKVKAQVSTPTSHVFKDDPEAEK